MLATKLHLATTDYKSRSGHRLLLKSPWLLATKSTNLQYALYHTNKHKEAPPVLLEARPPADIYEVVALQIKSTVGAQLSSARCLLHADWKSM
ncbi:hypothetical protein E2C01_088140 [Portunus trituberculatus]|uniref:Uncharacterized protein n=1 Tax=Portunus trituberculatus TaxID=210409 RepID=A0A5B7JEK9_PORTR|nr:hypothetical protein [Portunus trituberculatus]